MVLLAKKVFKGFVEILDLKDFKVYMEIQVEQVLKACAVNKAFKAKMVNRVRMVQLVKEV